jgi:hypothetical protein
MTDSHHPNSGVPPGIKPVLETGLTIQAVSRWADAGKNSKTRSPRIA